MKILLLLLVFLRLSFGYPMARTWTMNELSAATEKLLPYVPNIDPEKQPLVNAFDIMLGSIFTGKPDNVNALLLSPTGGKLWTKTQLQQALNDTNTIQYYKPFIGIAYAALNNYNGDKANKGKEKDTTEVPILALDLSTWTKDDITKALKDSNINPGLLPYLRKAQEEFDEAAAAGKDKEKVTIITPVGLIPPPEGVVPVIVPKGTIDDGKNKV